MLFHRKQADLPEVLPVHIGIIMDGNGRWAKKRGLPRFAGHKAGADTFKKIARYCNKIGIKYLTVYAFSTENWKRPQKEVEAIIDLLRNYLRDAENYKKENIRVRFIGDISVFDQEIRMKIAESQSESKEFTGLNLNIAINYGGKDEIVHAAKLLAKEAQNNRNFHYYGFVLRYFQEVHVKDFVSYRLELHVLNDCHRLVTVNA